MKILILNGSPRLNGNTRTALNEIAQGIHTNIPDAEVEFIDVTRQKLSGCTNCDSCKKNGGDCVMPDDSAKLIKKIFDSEVVIFGTPVYFWGINAQMKMVIDKMYSRDDQFPKDKKIGIVAVGEDALENRQYGLIREQFECICNYLGWNIVFSQSISAHKVGDLAGDKAKLQELSVLWQSI